MKSWQARVEELMSANGIRSKSALASRASLHPSVVARALKDDGDPQISTILKLAEALNVDLSEIFVPSRTSNLPPDLAAALGRIQKPVHVQMLRAVLQGAGLLDEAPVPARRSGSHE